MSILLHGDCLEEMKGIEDNSIDLIFCDLPYGETNCKWDCKLDLDKFWIEVMRIKKLNTPIFFTTTTKFGVSLIQSSPKKCFFRYDLIWVKSSGSGFLNSKRAPLRKHESIYVFYEKLPFYDLSSHTHKFIKSEKTIKGVNNTYNTEGRKKPIVRHPEGQYNPPLPNSVIKEEKTQISKQKDKDLYGETKGGTIGAVHGSNYEPLLPTSILEIKSTRGKHSTEKPVALIEWLLKYYSKEGDTVLDPTMGSGSTGVACKNMNRNFIGIEKDPEYYEVAVNRIEN